MNFGGFIRKIIIQSPPVVQDGGGELTGIWTNTYTAFAKIVDASSAESKAEGTEVMTTTREFFIRYNRSLTADMRILYDGNYYEIVGILHVDNNKFTRIITVQKSNV